MCNSVKQLWVNKFIFKNVFIWKGQSVADSQGSFPFIDEMALKLKQNILFCCSVSRQTSICSHSYRLPLAAVHCAQCGNPDLMNVRQGPCWRPSARAVFILFFSGNSRTAAPITLPIEEVLQTLQDLIAYFQPPEEEMQHEDKQNKLRSLKNRQNLFKEEVSPKY